MNEDRIQKDKERRLKYAEIKVELDNDKPKLPVEFSMEFREAMARLEHEMQESQAYFVEKIKKINRNS